MNSLFGSSLSLDAMLYEPLLPVGDGESLFQDLDVAPRSLGEVGFCGETQNCGTSSHTSSHSGVGYDALSDTGETLIPCSGPLSLSSGTQVSQEWPFHLPVVGIPRENLPLPVSQYAPPEHAALLEQLVATIQANPKPTGDVTQETFRTVPARSTPPQQAPAQPAANLTLPSLTAEQQQALQAIMNLGSLGSTPEGKKVKRMLSNRESARRSRHRKQAHMQELEEKFRGVQVENESLKLAVAKADEQELRLKTERNELHAEIAALRAKIEHLKQGESCDLPSKLSGHNADQGASERAGSHDSSCCVSGLKRSDPCPDTFDEPSKRIKC